MSIQFGVWQPSSPAIDERQMLELGQLSARHAPDGTFVACRRSVGMGLQPFITHERSKLELRPTVFADGCMVTLDGRIDNHAELREQATIADPKMADSILVAALFRRWGPGCFSKLVGDWAIALWSLSHQSLYLARDHAGARTLYFEVSEDHVLWSTVLDTFLAEGNTVELDEAYVARYLSCLPIRDLTPYRGIQAVPPAHYMVVNQQGTQRHRHWEPTTKEPIQYRSDIEYEDHFISLFRESVRRRTGTGAPILAELSGGMDSSSIVCISDRILTESGASRDEFLDTVSYFDDSEPNWDERRYFTVVEAQRGKAGTHLNIAAEDRSFEPMDPNIAIRPCTPGIDRYAAGRQRQLAETMAVRNYRVILSGIGGDEVLGGVPTPLPELADYLISFQLRDLVTRSLAFCLLERTPLLHLLAKTVASSAACYCTLLSDRSQVPPWISRRLRRIATDAQIDDAARVPRFGRSPSRIENGVSWWQTLETLPHLYPSITSRYEYRYPYLDRDLVEFLYRIPREQLVRPGRRRSLMRRALQGVVPAEILERPRKGSLIRAPLLSLQRSERAIQSIFEGSVAGAMGLIDEEQLKIAIAEVAKATSPRWWPAIIKAIQMEFWLRMQNGVLNETHPRHSILGISRLQAAHKRSAPAAPPVDAAARKLAIQGEDR
jgi:asparagine synthase (glutamine-hydrolysing)